MPQLYSISSVIITLFDVDWNKEEKYGLFAFGKCTDWNIIFGESGLQTLIDIVWVTGSACQESLLKHWLVFLSSILKIGMILDSLLETLVFWFMNVFKFLRFSKTLFHL